MDHDRKQGPEFFDPAPLEPDPAPGEQHIADQAERDRARVKQEDEGLPEDPREPRDPSQPFSGSDH